MRSTRTKVAKKCRTSPPPDEEEEDIITNLPESVICHILSRLSSKEAVRTSVLSKDWVYKWKDTDNIDINDRDRYSKERQKKPIFFKFMDKILLLPHDLKSFRLSCDRNYSISYLMKWISAALRRNTESFELQLTKQKSFDFPISLFYDNTSLRKLKLCCTLRLPSDNCFLNLTEICFYEVEVINVESNSYHLIFRFPVLKTLVLIGCKWLHVKLVEIYSPALCAFKCDRQYKYHHCGLGMAEVSEYSIKIRGARLEKFESFGCLPENIILHESTVHSAVLQSSVYKRYSVRLDLQARTLMKGFSNLIALELCRSFCEVLAQSNAEIPLPEFDKLQRLEICLLGNAKLLLALLHTAPSLKFLKLNWGEHEFDCAEVDFVPCCVTSYLEEVVFQGTNEKPLHHLATFFLKNGLKLKNVYVKDFIHRYSRAVMKRQSRTAMKATIKRLQEFPKVSASAKIFPPQSLSDPSLR